MYCGFSLEMPQQTYVVGTHSQCLTSDPKHVFMEPPQQLLWLRESLLYQSYFKQRDVLSCFISLLYFKQRDVLSCLNSLLYFKQREAVSCFINLLYLKQRDVLSCFISLLYFKQRDVLSYIRNNKLTIFWRLIVLIIVLLQNKLVIDHHLGDLTVLVPQNTNAAFNIIFLALGRTFITF